MRRITIAPITSTIKGLSTEVALGPANGLERPCVASCDNIITIDKAARSIGPPPWLVQVRKHPKVAQVRALVADG